MAALFKCGQALEKLMTIDSRLGEVTTLGAGVSMFFVDILPSAMAELEKFGHRIRHITK